MACTSSSEETKPYQRDSCRTVATAGKAITCSEGHSSSLDIESGLWQFWRNTMGYLAPRARYWNVFLILDSGQVLRNRILGIWPTPNTTRVSQSQMARNC